MSASPQAKSNGATDRELKALAKISLFSIKVVFSGILSQ
jgi:hypothetical protein